MHKICLVIGAGTLLLASAAFAQQSTAPTRPTAVPPARARQAPAPLQVPNPHYVSIPMSVEVNAPVAQVWARVGKFCDIGEWGGRGGANTCKIISGTDSNFGSVRSVANEVMVGKTQYSYTYSQAPRVGVKYNMYHGTLQAVPLTANTTRLEYTLFFDNSMLANDAARQADIANRRTMFTRFLNNMKILAEGGKLPAAAPSPARAGARQAGRGAARGRSMAPLMNPNPHYVSVPMSIEVNAPVAKVWASIGKFCDIGEWGFPGCKIISGTDGQLGVVRSIGNEVMVGKTKYSYTYTQPLRTTGGYNMYHGTLEARALTPTTTQLRYTLVYDNSSVPAASRQTEMNNRRTRFTSMLRNMKTLAEGGKLAPDALGRGRGRSAQQPSPGR